MVFRTRRTNLRLLMLAALLTSSAMTGCTSTDIDGGLNASGLQAAPSQSAIDLDGTSEFASTTTVSVAAASGEPPTPDAPADARGRTAASEILADPEASIDAVASTGQPRPPLPLATIPPTATTASTASAEPKTSLVAPHVLALAPERTKRRSAASLFRTRTARDVHAEARREARTESAGKSRSRSVRIVKPRKASNGSVLPGVRKRASLFQIGRLPANEAASSFRVASAAGMARLSSEGFRKQTAHVKTECFVPALVQTLRQVERHYGKPVTVTSGYRSPKGNRRAGGAKGSKHMSCEAADIQVEGVGKWELAKFLRSMPERGGVGTYCHTQSVHYDVGSERDWNWGCRK